MIIGIAGPQGVGKGVAADFLQQRIDGARVLPLADNPELLHPSVSYDAPVVIVPDVATARDAAQIRRYGKMVIMYGRGRSTDAAGVPIDGRDILIGNHDGLPELYTALQELAESVEAARS